MVFELFIQQTLVDSKEAFQPRIRQGNARGQVVEPLYPTVPQAVQEDAGLYALLALIDTLRVGKVREIHLAKEELSKRFAEYAIHSFGTFNLCGKRTGFSCHVFFVGGSVVELYVQDAGVSPVRPTEDVDFVLELTMGRDMRDWEILLSKQGFRHDMTPGAPICRWLLGETKVDIMLCTKQSPNPSLDPRPRLVEFFAKTRISTQSITHGGWNARHLEPCTFPNRTAIGRHFSIIALCQRTFCHPTRGAGHGRARNHERRRQPRYHAR